MCKEIHGDKYDYSKVDYKGYQIPVTIICPIHGEFQQTPRDHLRGSNCPKCKTSRGELLVEKYLIDNNISYTNQYFIDLKEYSKGIFVDFKVTINNQIYFIEYNGIQHYKPIEFFGGEEKFYNYQIPRDNKLREYCKENNIPLLEIKYTLKDEEVKDTLNQFLFCNEFSVSSK